MTKPRGRFAPSPTGGLHLGAIRTMAAAWASIRSQQGTFVMRIEDLDVPRVVAGSTERMLDELEWMGFDWDEGPRAAQNLGPYFQSERTHLYQGAFANLLENGLVYPCFCSRKDVREALSAPQASVLSEIAFEDSAARPVDVRGPVYPGTCRPRNTQATTASKPLRAYRCLFDSNRYPGFQDQLVGYQQVSDGGDFVVQRADGMFSYQFAVVVDDHLMQISEVCRGDDLISSTPWQMSLSQMLYPDAPIPAYLHVPILRDVDGARMSKRQQSVSVSGLKAEGKSSAEVWALLGETVGLPHCRSAKDWLASWPHIHEQWRPASVDPSSDF